MDPNMTLPYKEALAKLENGRVKYTRPLIPPQILQEDFPLYVVVRAIDLASHLVNNIAEPSRQHTLSCKDVYL
jgi:hypothetical protein